MKRAVALRYDESLPAPFVLAKGRGELASRLLEIAREYGIEVVEDDLLTESLFLLDIDEAIPEKMFEVVAALLAYVYRTRAKE